MPRGPATAALAAELDEPLREAIFGWTFRDPIFFHELLFPDISPSVRQTPLRSFVWSRDNHTNVFWSQFPMLLLQVLVGSSGRGVGKTDLGIVGDSLRRAICWPGAQITCLMSTLGMLEQKLVIPTGQIVRDHPILRLFVTDFAKGNLTCSFRNDSEIRWEYPGLQRAGEDIAQRMQGGRTTSQYIDEAQNVGLNQLREAHQQFQIAPSDPAMQASRGASRKVFGVDDGTPQSALAYLAKQRNSIFHGQREIRGRSVTINFRWAMPKFAAPYYTVAAHLEDLDVMGCDPDKGYFTAKYWRDIAGLPARAAESVFPEPIRNRASRHVTGFTHLLIPYHDYALHTVWDDDRKWLRSDCSFIGQSLPPPEQDRHYAIAFDIGTTAPSHVDIMEGVDGIDVWQLKAVVTMEGWSDMFDQCVVIDYLRARYRPLFGGYDASTVGASIEAVLFSNPLFTYRYRELLLGFTFSGYVPVVPEHLQQTDGSAAAGDKIPINQWTMERLVRHLTEETILIPELDQVPDLHQQLAEIVRNFRRQRHGGGVWIYTPNHQHLVSTLQCFTRAWEVWRYQGALAPPPMDYGTKGLEGILAPLPSLNF